MMILPRARPDSEWSIASRNSAREYRRSIRDRSSPLSIRSARICRSSCFSFASIVFSSAGETSEVRKGPYCIYFEEFRLGFLKVGLSSLAVGLRLIEGPESLLTRVLILSDG